MSSTGDSMTVDQLREQHESVRLRHEMAVMEAETAAISGIMSPGMHVDETAAMREAWGDRVAQQDYPSGQWDGSRGYDGLGWNTIGAQLGDRAAGAEQLVFQNEIDLDRIRAIGRLLGNSSVNARAVLNNLTSYILGVGYKYKAVAEEGEAPQEALLKTVQEILGEVRNENRWWEREVDLFQRCHRDGEYFVALYHVGGGHVQLRILEPEQNSEPNDPDAVNREYGLLDRPISWKFGIATDDDAAENIHGYWFRWRTPEGRDTGRFFDPSQITHCKLNVDIGIKRGITDFYPVYQQLLDAGVLLKNTVKGHAIMAAIAFIREHAEGVSQGSVETMRSSGAYARFNQATATEGTRTRIMHQYQTGTILDTGHGTKYKPSPMAEQGVGLAMVNVEEAVLRIAGTNWSMPAYMITGNVSEAAYASTLAAESPFTKYCERQQIYHGDEYAEIFWKALAIAHAAGRFDQHRMAFDEIKRLVKIEAKAPIVPNRDRNVESNRLLLLRNNGILSDASWAAKEGLDLEREQKLGAKEHVQENPLAGGDKPGQSVQKGKADKGKAEGSLREGDLAEAAQLLWGNYPGPDTGHA